MNRSLTSFDAAGLAAALAAAPVHTAEQGKVTFVLPISKNTEMTLQSYWPNLQWKRRGNAVPSTTIDTFDLKEELLAGFYPRSIDRHSEIGDFTIQPPILGLADDHVVHLLATSFRISPVDIGFVHCADTCP